MSLQQSSSERDTAREQLLSNAGNSGMDAEEIEHNKLTASLAKFTKLVVPFFLLILIFGIIALALGLVDSGLEGTLIWEVLGTGALGGLFGAWGVYKWGTLQDEIDRLKGENQKYEGEIGELKQTKTQLSTHVNEMQSSVQHLQGSVGDLNHQLSAFDDLRQELQSVAGDNQDIATLLDNTTKVFRDMRTVALANEKASLVSLYYDVAFKDGEPGMSAKEYERFKGRLPKKQRATFEAMGTFKELAGDNDIIDLSEFEAILEKFLGIIENELLQAGFENA